MRNNQNTIEDIINLGKIALEKLMDAEESCRGTQNPQNHDLVCRDEFDAAFAMLAKTRAMQEEINERIAAIETKLNLSSPHKATSVKSKKTKNRLKTNLPKVKHNKQKRRSS